MSNDQIRRNFGNVATIKSLAIGCEQCDQTKIAKSLQKLPKNVGDLGKLIVARGFKNLPKVQ